MIRFSAGDWFFVVVLSAIALVAAVYCLVPVGNWPGSIAGALGCLAAAAVIVNLYRYWQACAQLRRRGQER